ncbi:unnamed protein product [Amoebophrya sp. A120]|nr:unnamed protein product [Amoebophrya sp. A120]|eukprot:GSA120T00006943001.1
MPQYSVEVGGNQLGAVVIETNIKLDTSRDLVPEQLLPFVRAETDTFDFNAITNRFWRAVVHLSGVLDLIPPHVDKNKRSKSKSSAASDSTADSSVENKKTSKQRDYLDNYDEVTGLAKESLTEKMTKAAFGPSAKYSSGFVNQHSVYYHINEAVKELQLCVKENFKYSKSVADSEYQATKSDYTEKVWSALTGQGSAEKQNVFGDCLFLLSALERQGYLEKLKMPQNLLDSEQTGMINTNSNSKNSTRRVLSTKLRENDESGDADLLSKMLSQQGRVSVLEQTGYGVAMMENSSLGGLAFMSLETKPAFAKMFFKKAAGGGSTGTTTSSSKKAKTSSTPQSVEFRSTIFDIFREDKRTTTSSNPDDEDYKDLLPNKSTSTLLNIHFGQPLRQTLKQKEKFLNEKANPFKKGKHIILDGEITKWPSIEGDAMLQIGSAYEHALGDALPTDLVKTIVHGTKWAQSSDSTTSSKTTPDFSFFDSKRDPEKMQNCKHFGFPQSEAQNSVKNHIKNQLAAMRAEEKENMQKREKEASKNFDAKARSFTLSNFVHSTAVHAVSKYEQNPVPQPVSREFMEWQNIVENNEAIFHWDQMLRGDVNGMQRTAEALFYGDRQLPQLQVDYEILGGGAFVCAVLLVFLVLCTLLFRGVCCRGCCSKIFCCCCGFACRKRGLSAKNKVEDGTDSSAEPGVKGKKNSRRTTSKESTTGSSGKNSKTASPKESPRAAATSAEDGGKNAVAVGSSSSGEQSKLVLTDMNKDKKKTAAGSAGNKEKDQDGINKTTDGQSPTTGAEQPNKPLFTKRDCPVICVIILVLFLFFLNLSLSQEHIRMRQDQEKGIELFAEAATKGSWQATYQLALIAVQAGDVTKGVDLMAEVKNVLDVEFDVTDEELEDVRATIVEQQAPLLYGDAYEKEHGVPMPDFKTRAGWTKPVWANEDRKVARFIPKNIELSDNIEVISTYAMCQFYVFATKYDDKKLIDKYLSKNDYHPIHKNDMTRRHTHMRQTAGEYLKVAADLGDGNAALMLADEYMREVVAVGSTPSNDKNHAADKQSDEQKLANVLRIRPYDLEKALYYLELAVQVHGRIAANVKIWKALLLLHSYQESQQASDQLAVLTMASEKRYEYMVVRLLDLREKQSALFCPMLKHLLNAAYDMEPVSRLMYAIATRTQEIYFSKSRGLSTSRVSPGAALVYGLIAETGHELAARSAVDLLSKFSKSDIEQYLTGGGNDLGTIKSTASSMIKSMLSLGGGDSGSSSRASNTEASSVLTQAGEVDSSMTSQVDVDKLLLPFSRYFFCCPSGDCKKGKQKWLYNEGDHNFQSCVRECKDRQVCRFLTFYQSGYCQLSENCDSMDVAGDQSAITFELVANGTTTSTPAHDQLVLGKQLSPEVQQLPLFTGTITTTPSEEMEIYKHESASCIESPFLCAAQLALRTGNRDKAAENYEKAGLFGHSAVLYCEQVEEWAEEEEKRLKKLAKKNKNKSKYVKTNQGGKGTSNKATLDSGDESQSGSSESAGRAASKSSKQDGKEQEGENHNQPAPASSEHFDPEIAKRIVYCNELKAKYSKKELPDSLFRQLKFLMQEREDGQELLMPNFLHATTSIAGLVLQLVSTVLDHCVIKRDVASASWKVASSKPSSVVMLRIFSPSTLMMLLAVGDEDGENETNLSDLFNAVYQGVDCNVAKAIKEVGLDEEEGSTSANKASIGKNNKKNTKSTKDTDPDASTAKLRLKHLQKRLLENKNSIETAVRLSILGTVIGWIFVVWLSLVLLKAVVRSVKGFLKKKGDSGGDGAAGTEEAAGSSAGRVEANAATKTSQLQKNKQVAGAAGGNKDKQKDE